MLAMLIGLAVSLAAQCAPAVEALDPPQQGFFAKRVVQAGIAIKAHRSVDDRALLAARDTVARMLRSLPVVRSNLAAAGAELHIIGAEQAVSDLPENRHLKGVPYDGALTVDERTRGMGGLLASCGEENLLKLARDRYEGREICVHEFAHAIYGIGMDEATRELFAARYSSARREGLWQGMFAQTNADEFFAELSMWYFGTHGDPGRLARVAPGPAWLAAYDPQSYALMDRFYRGRIRVQAAIWQTGAVIQAGDERAVRSARTQERARLLIRNLSRSELRLYWLDFDGARKLYASIPAFGFAMQDTFADHAWMILSADGSARALTLAVRPGSILRFE